MLQAMPFPTEYGCVSDVMWGVRNLLASSTVLTPIHCSTLTFQSDEQSETRRDDIRHALTCLPRLVSQAIEEALAQTSASDRSELLDLREMITSMFVVGDLKRSYLECCARLNALRSNRFLWVLKPEAWRVRSERSRLKKRLIEAERAVVENRTQTAC
jgi:hypothetical protein